MPIKFRCPNCRQFLGISRAKAGSLTDCPTCGHSIRVPALDGSVEPVPEPAMDLGDSGLAKALDVLAKLDGSDFQAAQGAAVALKGSPPPIAAGMTGAATSIAPPAATPIRDSTAVAERPAPRPVAPAEPARAKGFESALKELNALAENAPSRAIERAERKSQIDNSWRLAAGGLALGGLLGFVAGRFSVGTPQQSVVAAKPAPETGADLKAAPPPAAGTAPAPAPPAALVPAVPGSAEFRTALTGRVTYTNENGESRPDEGARVLVFPETRQGSGKLPVVGFLAGAGEADVRLSRASLRALGGDFAATDSDGRYEVALPAAGSYQVLLISRYQDQKEVPMLENSLRKLLDSYFDRPNRVIGQVRYHFDSFRFDGASPTTKGHGFTR